MDEPKTVAALVSDLLRIAVENEWEGSCYVGCHCHPERYACCPSCKAFADPPRGGRHGGGVARTHERGCEYAATIAQARAFLKAENTLADEREDYDAVVSIP